MKNGGNAVSLTAKTDYYPGGMAMPNRNVVGDYRYNYQGPLMPLVCAPAKLYLVASEIGESRSRHAIAW